jgi:hypothetical protein
VEDARVDFAQRRTFNGVQKDGCNEGRWTFSGEMQKFGGKPKAISSRAFGAQNLRAPIIHRALEDRVG